MTQHMYRYTIHMASLFHTFKTQEKDTQPFAAPSSAWYALSKVQRAMQSLYEVEGRKV